MAGMAILAPGLGGEGVRTRRRGMAAFAHRRLRVYAAAVEASRIVYGATRHVPQRCVAVSDQLLRACTSIVLNLAEGVAEYSPGEKARFYRMARRSAAEASAALDLLVAFGAIDHEPAQRGTESLEAIAAMLTRMIIATQDPATRQPVPRSERLRDGSDTAAPPNTASHPKPERLRTGAATAAPTGSREPQKRAPETSTRNVLCDLSGNVPV
jgi:four helix bundle protein